ncbi:hypothetical protein [Micromonospora sonneratiae]|uniref:Uncharacterized protein n=1 Tax=Micromonospora sonneratiae TaxID=1184706 RepID=A0ABW3YHW0_9ACTN
MRHIELLCLAGDLPCECHGEHDDVEDHPHLRGSADSMLQLRVGLLFDRLYGSDGASLR